MDQMKGLWRYLCWLLWISVPKMRAIDVSARSLLISSPDQAGSKNVSHALFLSSFENGYPEVASTAFATTTFIGDYFGNSTSDSTNIASFVSTYNDGSNLANRQQQVIATVAIP